jgi:hypothetical protein
MQAPTSVFQRESVGTRALVEAFSRNLVEIRKQADGDTAMISRRGSRGPQDRPEGIRTVRWGGSHRAGRCLGEGLPSRPRRPVGSLFDVDYVVDVSPFTRRNRSPSQVPSPLASAYRPLPSTTIAVPFSVLGLPGFAVPANLSHSAEPSAKLTV